MPSSKSKGKEKSSRHTSQYPSDWSDWEWSNDHGKYIRYMWTAKGKQEFEFGEAFAESSDPTIPRTDANELYTVAETSQQANGYATAGSPSYTYSEHDTASSSNYTYDKQQNPMDALSQSFSRTTIADSKAVKIKTADKRTKSEPLDPRFRVHKSGDFKFGKIFKVIWSEPSGETGGTQLSVRGNEHIKVRRFVVVKNMKGHCICLSIMSYGGRGTTKPGVNAEHHAIIYTDESPVLFEGENGMTLAPLQAIPDNPEHGLLDPASRLNYGKLYTVEHNVKVWFVAKLTSSHEGQLKFDYDSIHPSLSGGSSSSGGRYGMGHSGGSGSRRLPYSQDQIVGYTGSQYQPQSSYPNYHQASHQSYGNTPDLGVSYTPYSLPQTFSYGNPYGNQSQDTYGAYQPTQQTSYSSGAYTTPYQSNSSQPPAEDFDTQNQTYSNQ